LSLTSKSKDPLAEIEARMERFKKPLLERDFAYFMRIGLNASQNVVHEKLMETFGKVTM
jgi:hypothetical protein